MEKDNSNPTKMAKLIAELAITKEELQITRATLDIKLKNEEEMGLKLNNCNIDSSLSLTNRLSDSQEQLIKIKTEMETLKENLDSKENEANEMKIEACSI